MSRSRRPKVAPTRHSKLLFSPIALFIFLTRITCSKHSYTINITNIYNIIDISMFLGLGNIHIIHIISIIYIINISLPWTKCGQCPHPFTIINILHILIYSNHVTAIQLLLLILYITYLI